VLQVMGAVFVLLGAAFVFYPGKTRDTIQRIAKKTNEQYAVKGLAFIILGAILLYLGVN